MKEVFLSVLIILMISLSGYVYAIAPYSLQKGLERVDDLRYAEAKEEGEALDNYKKALAFVEKLIDRYPDSPEVYVKAASCSSNLNDFESLDDDYVLNVLEKGERYSDKAIELDPDNSYAYFHKAALMGQIGLRKGIFSSLSKVKPMRDNLLKSIELNPEFAPAYDVLATLYQTVPGWPISIGNKNKALEYRLKAVEVETDNINYWLALYNLYKDRDKIEEAKQLLEDFRKYFINKPAYADQKEAIKKYISEESKKLEELE